MSSQEKTNTRISPDTRVQTQEKVKLKRPDMYAVILLNDDYTPQEFVVWVIMRVFYKSNHESQRIMQDAHTKGRSVIGVYTFDVARTKVIQVQMIAKEYEHPLECIIEVKSNAEETKDKP